ncbi:MAG: DNA mismatch repair protein MutS, partial [Actinobacteria bacterium]|nr:DNA mismatch repair protein MutS [Actinomycetota bacterium]
MKVHLMYPDRDFDPRAALPGHEPDLTADLELDTLLDAMAAGDAYLRDVARRGLHDMLMVPAEITYRQHVLADCAAHPDVIRGLYDLAIEAIAAERQVFGFMFRDSPEMILHRSRQVMALYVTYLRRLADLAARCAPDFRSEGLTTLCAMLKTELTAGYLAEMEDHLDGLEFRRGTLISARLGTGATGTGYTLRRHPPSRGWRDRLPAPSRAWQSFTIPERDEAGHRYVSELTGRGVNDTANALAQSVDHVKGFFQLLRAELGFYLGCLNLRGRLTGRGQPVCYPDPAPPGRDTLTARGLYDASLTLTAEGEITGNDLAADGKKLIMITGANQGGKSTFLRAVGQAQL